MLSKSSFLHVMSAGCQVVKLFRLSNSSCCRNFMVLNFILVYMHSWWWSAVHVYKMCMLPRHSYCQDVHVVRVFMLSGCSCLHIVHVIRIFLLTKYLKNCFSLECFYQDSVKIAVLFMFTRCLCYEGIHVTKAFVLSRCSYC